MPVCWYYQQGRCRYGDRCRYEHPRDGFRRDVHDTHHRGGGNNYNRYHWTNSNNGSTSPNMRSRAAAFDFNATLERARAKEISVWNRGGGDNATSLWTTRDLQCYRSDVRDSSQERSYVDRGPEVRGRFTMPPREELRGWGRDGPAGGSAVAAAAFDFNRTLETVRQQEAHRYQDEDLDMAPVEELQLESCRPHGGSGPFGESSHTLERGSAPAASGPAHSPFVLGHIRRSDLQPNYFQQDHQRFCTLFGETVRKEDSRCTSRMELDLVTREQYLSENFTLGRIPVQPPPPEYCR